MKGAIFDMDGLLLDSERLYQSCWHQLARDRGLTLPSDFAVRITGSGPKQAHLVLRSCYPDDDPDALTRECMAMMVEREKTDLQLKPGAADLLPALKKAGYRLAVASSSPRDMVLTNLGRTGIDSYFDVVVCGDEVSRGKPDPDIFLLAARAAGCRPVMIPDLVPPAPEFAGFASVYPDLTAFGNAIL